MCRTTMEQGYPHLTEVGLPEDILSSSEKPLLLKAAQTGNSQLMTLGTNGTLCAVQAA